jgi:hypothetical protein
VRRAAAVDANQQGIIGALRKAGASVQPLHTVGQGCPDLLCGFRGQTHLIEIKDGAKSPSRRALTPDQMTWHALWWGRPVAVVKSIPEALAVIGVEMVE